jgi:crotonobetainyl-CoA:carnitine CoA-transferase CaiB-like acyl-CoA transferase
LGYSAGYRLYKTADDYICVAIQTTQQWQTLFDAVGHPELTSDARFADDASRAANDAALTELLISAFSKKAAKDWFAVLDSSGVPAEISDPTFFKWMWRDESFIRDRQWLVNLPHPVTGHVGSVGLPYSFSDMSLKIERRPLIVGECTREILTEMGYSTEQQSQLFEAKTVEDESCYMYDLGLN